MSGREWGEEETREAANNLIKFFDLVYDVAKQEQERNRKLKKFPKGYHLEEGHSYSCKICSRYIEGKETWYDKYGIKCIDCQRNLDKGVLPKKICKNEDLWFKDWQIQSDLGIHPMTAKKLRREGKLISRDLKNKDGYIYFRVYLRDENKVFLRKIKWKEKNRTNPIMVDKEGLIF